MNSKKKSMKTRSSEGDIDKIVESQAKEDSASERPIKVRREKSPAVSLPAVLAARAAFLAKLHREKMLKMVVAHH